jgi:AAA domain, putative AbiEii toxin, Type IV TA system
MITTLQTQQYKKIGNPGIRLEELVGVNYFVGENSSGKTSLLRYIFDFNRSEALWIADSFSELDHLKEFDFKKTLAKGRRNILREIFTDSLEEYHYLSLDLLAYSILESKNGLKWRSLDQELYLEAIGIAQDMGIVSEDLVTLTDGAVLELDGEELNSGAHKLINMIYGVVWAYKILGARYYLFDNPGDHLHPSWQKHLPAIFQYLHEQLDVQIFVATHSPFVITAAGVLGEESVTPIQKVYFLINGQIASKRGIASAKGSKGYWGTRVAEISSKMLGVGLMDLVSKQVVSKSVDSPVLVLCEGEGENADARIYNIIFRNRIPNVMFVSSRGSSQLYKSFSILTQIKPGLSADFEVRMLRDRDHEFPTEQSIYDYEASMPNCKVLRKRAIESYLYNLDTAKLVLSLFNKKLLKKDLVQYNLLAERILASTQHGIQGDEYKQELLEWFQSATRGYLRELMRNSKNTIMERVAYLIYPGHPVYQELEGIIFG